MKKKEKKDEKKIKTTPQMMWVLYAGIIKNDKGILRGDIKS